MYFTHVAVNFMLFLNGWDAMLPVVISIYNFEIQYISSLMFLLQVETSSTDTGSPNPEREADFEISMTEGASALQSHDLGHQGKRVISL